MKGGSQGESGAQRPGHSSPLSRRLEAFPFLRELDPAGRERLAAVAFRFSQEAGVLLVDQGGAIDPLVLVERGAIRVLRSSDDGREITLYRVLPGELCVLALTGVVENLAYPAQAVTETRVEGLALPAAALQREIEAQPALRRFVVRMLLSRLVESMELCFELAFARVDARLARKILALSRREGGMLAPIEKTHAELAAELGTAREVVTRLLNTFEQQGLVSLARRRILVEDESALADRAGQ